MYYYSLIFKDKTSALKLNKTLLISITAHILQHGNEAASVADLKIADQLYHYMVGGQTKPQVSFNYVMQ